MITTCQLNDDEQMIMQRVLDVHAQVLKWGLIANKDELYSAIHTIQSFIIHHMLQRLNPDYWSHWYQEIGMRTGLEETVREKHWEC